MIKNHINKLLLSKLGHSPTSSQQELIAKLSDFIGAQDSDIFIIKGYAGTGKTTLINSLVKTLKAVKFKSLLLAPTGRAAKVITQYTKRKAYTIHKKIYRQKSSSDGFGNFVLDINLHTDTYFIVDEASMINDEANTTNLFGSGRLLEDLITFTFNRNNCKLILVGDIAQLPPVGTNLSPALNKKDLEKYGKKVAEYELTDVIRQAQESGILLNATKMRQQLFGKIDFIPNILHEGFEDVESITGDFLIDSINDSYDRNGIEETLIVCRSNKRANLYNQGIRKSILWREEEISIGDLLMVVKNNYHWLKETNEIDFIANGDIVEITRIRKIEELYGLRYADVTVKFVDYEELEIDTKIILDTLTIDSASLPASKNKELYYAIAEDYPEVKSKKAKFNKIKENPYFNALQVKFAYAITCHKSQGGQWHTVFIDQGYLNDDMMNDEYLRWLYTAFTRSTEKLYLVNFNKKLLNSSS